MVPLCGTKVVVRKDSGTCPSDHSKTSESARSQRTASIAVSHPVVVVVVVSVVAAAVWREEEEEDVKNVVSDSTKDFEIVELRLGVALEGVRGDHVEQLLGGCLCL